MDIDAGTWQGITYIIPCAGSKLDRPAPARDLYTGTMFRHTLNAAELNAAADEQDGEATRILILSAEHGLVGLDTVLAPYEQRMDQAGSVTAEVLAIQAGELGIGWGSQVYCLLPGAYYRRLDEALRTLDAYATNVYEATGGIGAQRGVNRHVATV